MATDATTEPSSRAATPSAVSKSDTQSGPSSRPFANGPRGRMGMSVAVPSMPASNPIPLSARKSPGLDLSTVERRGQPNCPKPRDPKPSRPHGLQEAPTFRPTEEEFRNGPIEYIKTIQEEGRKYGIVKIVPPSGWNPDFAIDTEVRFPSAMLGSLRRAAFSFPNQKAGTQPR
jgi:hypothetical protein